jgi:hypothetical protein
MEPYRQAKCEYCVEGIDRGENLGPFNRSARGQFSVTAALRSGRAGRARIGSARPRGNIVKIPRKSMPSGMNRIFRRED